MSIALTLIRLATSQLVKAMLGGRMTASDGAAFASSAVEGFLGQLVATQADTVAALTRLEGKIDEVLAERYRTSLEVGYRNLQQAQLPHRATHDRQRMLDEALQRFMEASSNARSTEAKIDAELLSAACWLAKGSVQDFYARAGHAAHVAFEDVQAAAKRYGEPPAAEVIARADAPLGAFAPVRRLLQGDDAIDSPRLESTRAAVRREAAAARDASARRFNAVQQLRQAYGADPADAPELDAFFYPGEGGSFDLPGEAELATYVSHGNTPTFLLLGDRPARFGGVGIAVREQRISTSAPGAGLVIVDANIEVTARDPGFVKIRAFAVPNLPYGAAKPDIHDARVKEQPFLPSQIGLPLWDGKRAKPGGASVRLAVRLVAPSSPEFLVIDVTRTDQAFSEGFCFRQHLGRIGFLAASSRSSLRP